MEEVYEFLRKSGCFYFATCDGDQPRVRPFGVIEIYEGHLYFLTGKKKNVMQQIRNNPKVEICATIGEEWIRVEGEVKTDEVYTAKKLGNARNPFEFSEIKDTLFRATRMYAEDGDFDSVKMDLSLGLIYDVSDVDENQKPKANAKPIKGIVRYQTGSVKSYLDEKQTNKMDYGSYGFKGDGFITYKVLMAGIKSTGLDYTGPKTFEEFIERILSGETFDVSVLADIKPKTEEKQNSGFAK